MIDTTRRPFPVPLAMSTASPSPIPTRHGAEPEENTAQSHRDNDGSQSPQMHPVISFPRPKLRLKCEDLSHAAASIFFYSVDPSCCLQNALTSVLNSLYGPLHYRKHIPATRSVTLMLLPMSGVADTGGILLDNEHKRMRFSLDYIHNIQKNAPHRVDHEIRGVLVHEMVHAWQWNGRGTAPSGLIEGIADYVRLMEGLAPPHWKRVVPDNWDAGYQHTAYFLEWLDQNVRQEIVRDINVALRHREYREEAFWQNLCGRSVNDLFEDYKSFLVGGKPNSQDNETCKPSMADSEFWDIVRREKGEEQAILLKAVWRVNRHARNLTDGQREALQSLEDLWPKYVSGDANK